MRQASVQAQKKVILLLQLACFINVAGLFLVGFWWQNSLADFNAIDFSCFDDVWWSGGQESVI